jgi:hypothetical protein
MERVMGIEPTCSAWKADILPLNYTRERAFSDGIYFSKFRWKCQGYFEEICQKIYGA